MTPQRWFWLLLLVCAIWAFLGIRTTPKTGVWTNPPLVKRIQTVVWVPVDTLLTPVKWVPTQIQTFFTGLVAKLMQPAASAGSVVDKENRIKALENELLYQTGRVTDLEKVIVDYKGVVAHGIDSRLLLQATVTGYESGMATNIVTLDKGSSDGIKGPAVVLSQLSPIGRIVSLGPKTSTVRLLTDPRVKVQASIVRRTPTGLVTIVPNCLVTGIGGGRMVCDTVAVTAAPVKPEPGDLVRLNDQEWPIAVRNMVLGEVAEVTRKESRFLLYDIRIVPRVNIHSISTAIVVLE